RWPLNAWTTGLVAASVAAVALLIIALQPSPAVDDVALNEQPQNLTTAGPPAASKTRPSKKDASPVAARTDSPRSTMRNQPAIEPVKASAVESAAPAPPVETNPITPAHAAPVTITGCLELDDETFRLRDTAGTDAPKSRG